MSDPGAALDAFHPRIRDWFRRRHGTPTDIQAEAWPRIAAGDHVLATAPTGSGKTLCAFLAPLDHLLSGRWSGGTTRVLYVSPLKALNNDVRRNLLEPLAELAAEFEAAGERMPEVRVATRSGDTPPDERRRLQRHPPEILITTPESLAILLTSAGGRGMLDGVRMLILDEIHAVAGSRRGLWLMQGCEALVELAGEVQRVALSATVQPLEDIARLVGGHAPDATGRPAAAPRRVHCLRSALRRRMALTVRALPPDELPGDGGLDALAPIARAIGAATTRNRSTLVFANSRALCEKLALRVNEHSEQVGAPATEPLAFAHHGSLSREIRMDVEARLKAGRLRAIVATSSLEMGIDIGSLDEVVMVQTPPSVAAAVQRAGRAGHGVGELSRAVLYPTHPQDALEAAALARAVLAADIEPTRVPGPCLDVLAQMIIVRLSMAPRSADALFDSVRCVSAYRELGREPFDLVVQMLLGRYAATRVRELQPRLLEDPATGTLHLRRGTLLTLYAAGGMITNRGYYQLRHAETQARIGELDEEFVWENGPGRAFSLGSSQWRVQRVTHNDVFVVPAPEARHAPPFWRSEDRDRDSHFSLRLGELLAECDAALDAGPEALDALLQALPLDAAARTLLADHLRRQREHTRAPLPHAGHLLVESVRSGPAGYGAGQGQLVLHTLAGGRVNRPWALALQARWQAQHGDRPEVHVGNDAIVIQLSDGMTAEAILDLIGPEDVEPLLRERLAGSGTFGARFRECAGRALLLSRGRPGQRQPLWMSRLQSQRLLGRVRRFGDFPIVLEAWRSCLEESFDLPGLRERLTDLHSGALAVSCVTVDRPSPFAAESGWRQINTYMYADDEPRGDDGSPSGLHPTLLESVVADARLRPRVTADTARAFLQRVRRLEPGWGPRDALELQDWLRERRLLPHAEFATHARAAGLDPAALDWWAPVGGDQVVHRRDAAEFAALFPATGRDDPDAIAIAGSGPGPELDRDPAAASRRTQWLADWLQAQGPATLDELDAVWPGPRALLTADLQDLEETGELVRAPLLDGDERERLCSRTAFEAMLRMQRARARPQLEPVPAAAVPAFLARWQHLGADVDLIDALEPLRALPMQAALWESALLPARTGAPGGAALDAVLGGDGLRCVGQGRGRIAFVATDELDALPRQAGVSDDALAAMLPDPGARYDFEAFRARHPDDASAAATDLWDALFAGRIAPDSFEPIRHGIATRFTLPTLAAARAADGAGPDARPAPRSGVRRGSLRARIDARVRGVPGRFLRLPATASGDAVDRLERARQRARILLDRWGIVSPSLLRREAKGLRWGDVFRALRVMELAGEVTGGLFLTGLDGPQFAAPEAVAWLLADGSPRLPGPVWMAATDPASPCGLDLPLAGLPLPRRVAGAELVLAESGVALVLTRSGRSLGIDPALGEDALDAVLATLARTFAWRRPGQLEVTRIDDAPARGSGHLAALRRHFEVTADHRGIVLAAPPARPAP